jgi:membrane protein
VVLVGLLRQTIREWRDDRGGHHGAALAFYALFALAPLTLILSVVTGRIFGAEAAQERLALELAPILTPEVARTAQAAVASAAESRAGVAASTVGVLFSLYGGVRGFLELQATLNAVWGVRAIRGPGLLEILRRKALAFASVVLCGSLLLASIVATMVLHPVASSAASGIAWPFWMARRGEDLSSFVLAALLLTVVFKTLPDVRIRWRDVFVGAGLSAVLFVLGKHGIAYYLRHASTASAFGAAGTLVAVLTYVNFSAQAVLFGAKFTYVYARHRGEPLEPADGAARVIRTVVRDAAAGA